MCFFSELFMKPTYSVDTWAARNELLYPEELAWIKEASTDRAEEFSTVRACAREALSCLGIARPVLIADTVKGLDWPEGIVGSLTHTHQYRAALVARTCTYQSVGIDAERAVPLPIGIDELVLTRKERFFVKKYGKEQVGNIWGTILFSAKESVYKTWRPLVGQFLHFQQVELTVSSSANNQGYFTAEIDSSELPVIQGAWRVSSDLIRTGAWMEADGIKL